MYRIMRSIVLFFIVSLVIQTVEANAASYVVLPFKVNASSGYTYLEKAIPSMLTSRLYWEEHFHPISDADAAKAGKVTNVNGMEKARIATGADFLIWGEVSVVGDDATIDVRVCSSDEKIWRKTSNTKINNLISALQEIAEAINSELFGRVPTKTNLTKQHESITQMNPGLIHSHGESQVYLNPQFRYHGNDESRGRSQALPFASVGISVADFTGDKKNEVAILSEYKVHMYRWEGERLVLLGEYKLPRGFEAILIRNFDIDHDGIQEIIVSCFEPSYNKPYAFVLSFKGGVFKEVSTRIPFYLNVVKLPPDFSPKLIGQKSGTSHVFSRSGVYEIGEHGGEFIIGDQLDLPKEANVFNFTWLPGTSDSNDDNKLIVVNSREELVTYNSKGSKLSVTGEVYYGSSVGIDEQSHMPGLGKNKDVIPTKYFIPSRMIPIDLEHIGRWELLVNKPISVAAKFFENYRSFAEGEIQALSWDGVGLGLIWKTRRIKGTIIDFALADMNNDTILDLVVAVNSHTGVLGLEKRRTIVLFYPLKMNNKGSTVKSFE